MRDSALDKMSVAELMKLQARVERKLQDRREQEKMQLREKFKQMASSAGLSLVDVVGGGGRGRPRGSVAPKYVNPEDPSLTWSGRGRMPKWLSEKVKSGVDRKKFAIK